MWRTFLTVTSRSSDMSSLRSVPSAVRRAWPSTPGTDSAGHVSFDSRAGALWTIVIALDFFWLSNPLVLWTFADSMRNACAVTLAATLLTPLRRPLRPPLSVVAVLGFGFLTVAWSDNSIFTLHFTLIYLAVAVVALAITATVDARTLAQGVLLGAVLYVLASVWAFEIGIPGSVMSVASGEFPAGVGMNRNILSYTVILAVPFALSFVPRTWRGRAAWATGVAVLLWGVYLSQSDTGIVAAVVLCGAAAAMGWRDVAVARTRNPARNLRWTRRIAPLVILVAGVVVLLTSGEDATLSGRTPFWSATWQTVHGWDRWFGAGWGVVWPHPWFPTAANEIHTEIVERAGTFLVHGHNSFFDLLPELGLIGSALFATTYLQAAAHGLSLRRLAVAPTAEGLEVSRMILLGLLALLLYGVTEPMSTIPLGWFVIVMLASDLAPRRSRELTPEDTPALVMAEVGEPAHRADR